MLQQVLELVNSETVVEIGNSGVKVFDNTPGYRPLRQMIELEDAVTLAKAILSFAEAQDYEDSLDNQPGYAERYGQF